jgi:hypothetical protein
MFKGVVGFFKDNPMVYGSSFVIFVILAIAVWIFIKWRSKKNDQYKAAAGEDKKPENTMKRVEDYPPAPPFGRDNIISKEISPQPVQETLYGCSCGVTNLTIKELRKHLLSMGRKENGKHKSLGKITPSVPPVATMPTAVLPQVVAGAPLIVDPKQTYRAVIWRYAGGGRESVIECKQRIDKPLGNIWYAEPSLPISGECYCVKELENGNYEPYDPRQSNLKADETPTQAYLATHWDRAEGVWMYVVSNIQKISMFVIGGFLFITFIAILIKLGGK